MGKSFITKYVVLADGEKDPRNLLVAFAIARVILIEFDITGLVEASDQSFVFMFQLHERPIHRTCSTSYSVISPSRSDPLLMIRTASLQMI